jgi:CRP/FNR family cyclic AMP-dependent transcriptional regulator
LDADHPENGVLIPRLSTRHLRLHTCVASPVRRSTTQLVPLMQTDPTIAIRVGQLAEIGNRLGAWIARDLLTPDAGCRLASVLFQALGTGEVVPDDPQGFWLTHQQLGEMANLSRHHVGRKLASFEKAGWISCGDNRVRLVDAEALSAFAYGDEDT